MESGTGDPVWCSGFAASRLALIAALELEAKIATAAGGGAVVYTSGPGRDRSLAATNTAIANGAAALISWGLAGGLSGEVDTGTVVLPASIVNGSGEWRTDAAWRQRLEDALGSRFPITDRPLYTADDVVTTPKAKAKLASRTGAVAVDMESSGLAQAAADAGRPFVVLRVVADGPGDALPEGVASLVTVDGRTNYRRLVDFAVSPRRFRLLLRLAVNSSRARAVLKQVVGVLLQSAR